ncbi:MAG: pilus assembly protein TadG-related protein [Candidatus Omnitrophica bacterium]|nr:pilus assembly protein TadG-related protein [Candidatus Omnitrophota bacterium]
MLKNLRQYYFTCHKSQTSIFFLSIIALLIIITFVTVNIGKIARDKTNASNAADAGALAACSVMATGFNFISDRNQGSGKGQDGDLQHDAQKYQKDPRFPNATEPKNGRVSDDNNLKDQQHQTKNSENLSPGALPEAQAGNADSNIQRQNDQTLQEAREVSDQQAQENAAKMQDAMSGTDGTPNNYEDNAIAMGYKYNFYNSGVQLKVAGTKINSKRWEEFLKGLEPGMVRSGEPKTFFWVDGAGRAHVVTAIIEVEPTDNVEEEASQDGRSQTRAKNSEAQSDYSSAETSAGMSIGNHILGIAQPSLDPSVHAPAGHANMKTSQGSHAAGNAQDKSAEKGREGQKVVMRNNIRAQSTDDSINGFKDIVNSQTIYSVNFQFHMGGPVKGMRGDVDVPTFYPPVQSSAQASFNYNQRGHIRNPSGQESDPNFECGLISAF